MAGPGYKPSLSRNRWNSLKIANRIPEVEQERKLTDIRRFYAQFKRDIRIEEGRIWDYLFENELILRKSVARHRMEDVLSGVVPIAKRFAVKEDPPRYSEVYRQFIIFKAVTLAKVFGNRAPKRPKYSDLYAKEEGYKMRNDASVEELFMKLWQAHGRESYVLLPATTADPERGEEGREEVTADSVEGSAHSTAYRRGVVEARPHHSRGYMYKKRRPSAKEVEDDIDNQDQVVLPPIG